MLNNNIASTAGHVNSKSKISKKILQFSIVGKIFSKISEYILNATNEAIIISNIPMHSRYESLSDITIHSDSDEDFDANSTATVPCILYL